MVSNPNNNNGRIDFGNHTPSKITHPPNSSSDILSTDNSASCEDTSSGKASSGLSRSSTENNLANNSKITTNQTLMAANSLTSSTDEKTLSTSDNTKQHSQFAQPSVVRSQSSSPFNKERKQYPYFTSEQMNAEFRKIGSKIDSIDVKIEELKLKISDLTLTSEIYSIEKSKSDDSIPNKNLINNSDSNIDSSNKELSIPDSNKPSQSQHPVHSLHSKKPPPPIPNSNTSPQGNKSTILVRKISSNFDTNALNYMNTMNTTVTIDKSQFDQIIGLLRDLNTKQAYFDLEIQKISNTSANQNTNDGPSPRIKSPQNLKEKVELKTDSFSKYNIESDILSIKNQLSDLMKKIDTVNTNYYLLKQSANEQNVQILNIKKDYNELSTMIKDNTDEIKSTVLKNSINLESVSESIGEITAILDQWKVILLQLYSTEEGEEEGEEEKDENNSNINSSNSREDDNS